MRVLHVITGLNLGGAEVMLQRLLEASDREDLTQEVVSLTDLGVMAEAIRRLGVGVHALGMTRVPSAPKLVRLARLVARFRPDVVQTWMYHADLLGGVAARHAGAPRVCWGIHNNALDAKTHRTTRWTVALCARLSRRIPDRIVCVSSASRDLHVRAGYAADKFVLMPNGFDLTRFRPDPDIRREVRRELGLHEDSIVVGLVARIDPQKDHTGFIRAAALLARRRPDTRFLLCGDGTTHDNRELVDAIARERLQDRFLLLGRRTDVNRIMTALDIGTLSSTS
jgi:glycosyltransferase involved in cell wall biosynthesis